MNCFPTALCPLKMSCSSPREMMTFAAVAFGSSLTSPSLKLRPETIFTPSASVNVGDAVYSCVRHELPSPPAAFTSPELPPPCHGMKFVLTTAFTPGIVWSARTSDRVVVMRNARSPNESANGRLNTHSRLSSSKPDAFCIFVRSVAIMFTALVTTASVIAICSTISSTRVRLRVRARTIGPISMMAPSDFQLHGRLQFAGAPRGIEAGDSAGNERQKERGEDHLQIE